MAGERDTRSEKTEGGMLIWEIDSDGRMNEKGCLFCSSLTLFFKISMLVRSKIS